jgi:hypothetical protein
MRRRDEGEHNAGYWEVPVFDGGLEAASAQLESVCDPGSLEALGGVRHTILNRAFAVSVHAARAQRARKAAPAGYAWIEPGPSAQRPWTTLARKVHALATR